MLKGRLVSDLFLFFSFCLFCVYLFGEIGGFIAETSLGCMGCRYVRDQSSVLLGAGQDMALSVLVTHCYEIFLSAFYLLPSFIDFHFPQSSLTTVTGVMDSESDPRL